MTPKKVITLHKMLLDLKIKSLEDRLSPKSDIKKQLINIIKIK